MSGSHWCVDGIEAGNLGERSQEGNSRETRRTRRKGAQEPGVRRSSFMARERRLSLRGRQRKSSQIAGRKAKGVWVAEAQDISHVKSGTFAIFRRGLKNALWAR